MKSNEDPYQVIKHRHITEKSTMLEQLHQRESNPSLKRCEQPKHVFIVHPKASKRQIAKSLEQIYSKQKIRVVAVNTINVKGKKCRFKRKIGRKAGFKKAIVTLEKGDQLDNV